MGREGKDREDKMGEERWPRLYIQNSVSVCMEATADVYNQSFEI